MGRLRRAFVVAGAVWVVTLITPMPVAVACTCAPLPPGDPVELAGHRAPELDHAFIGTIARYTDPVRVDEIPEGSRFEPGTYQPAVLEVEVTLAGVPAERVIILQHSRAEPNEIADDCSYGFVVGGRYLVEAETHSEGIFLTDGCTLTQPYGAQTAADTRPAPVPEAAPPDGGTNWLGAAVIVGALFLAVILVLTLTFRQRPRVGDPWPQDPPAGS